MRSPWCYRDILEIVKGAGNNYPGHRWHYVLNQMAVTGWVANLQLIGGSFPGYDNDGIKNYRLEVEYEKALGFVLSRPGN